MVNESSRQIDPQKTSVSTSDQPVITKSRAVIVGIFVIIFSAAYLSYTYSITQALTYGAGLALGIVLLIIAFGVYDQKFSEPDLAKMLDYIETFESTRGRNVDITAHNIQAAGAYAPSKWYVALRSGPQDGILGYQIDKTEFDYKIVGMHSMKWDEFVTFTTKNRVQEALALQPPRISMGSGRRVFA